MKARLSLAALACCFVASCAASRKLADPTLLIETTGGRELGVSTEYGIVFLGRTARSGPVSLTVWYGDGPSVEASVIEPLGGGLYTAETEIRFPIVPMTFRTPRPGDPVAVIGRRRRTTWEAPSVVTSDPRVEGILIEPVDDLRGQPHQIGAGVYIDEAEEDGGRRLFLGLISGSLELTDADGTVHEYLTVMGPEELWRLVTFRRDKQGEQPLGHQAFGLDHLHLAQRHLAPALHALRARPQVAALHRRRAQEVELELDARHGAPLLQRRPQRVDGGRVRERGQQTAVDDARLLLELARSRRGDRRALGVGLDQPEAQVAVDRRAGEGALELTHRHLRQKVGTSRVTTA
jgi:hypothetical protein